MPKQPAVLSGRRGPKDSPRRRGREAAAKAVMNPAAEIDEQSLLLPSDDTMKRVEEGPPPRQKGKRFRFRSRYEKHMLLLRAIPSTKSFDGRTVAGQTDVALFRDYNYETDDPAVNDLIRKHNSFGVTFWDADEQDQSIAVAEYENFVQKISTSPALRERLRKDLSKRDFSVVETLAQPVVEKEEGEQKATG